LHSGLGCALSELKRDPDLFRIAVVLIDGPADVAATVDALERGAHDVLRDDAPPGELVARVRAARRARDMQEQLLSREHELEAMAYHDELTGVANRRFAVRQLRALLSRARRHDQELSVILLDADRFKALNDRHGHGAGDDVLRGLAGRLRSRVREEDVVARFGGEEFLVILPDTGDSGAATAAEDLRAAVAAQPFRVGRFALPLTVSAGWATWRGESLERLVARADRGLYAAKEAGRDCVRPGDSAGAPSH
jgi:two-component system cell cycle response regulator